MCVLDRARAAGGGFLLFRGEAGGATGGAHAQPQNHPERGTPRRDLYQMDQRRHGCRAERIP